MYQTITRVLSMKGRIRYFWRVILEENKVIDIALQAMHLLVKNDK
jgi:hypothetical protein